MIHFMQHIKNNILYITTIKLYNIIISKKTSKQQLLGPSLSIVKPEVTAIFSILNRIVGIILVLFFISFSFIYFKNLQIFSFYFFTFFIFILFIILYHIIYGRIKLTLYFNNVYLFINRNINTINNLLYIYIYILLLLLLSNVFIYIYLFTFKHNINFEYLGYVYDFFFLYYFLYLYILNIKYYFL